MSARKAILWGAGLAAGLLVGLAVDERAYHAFARFGEEHESPLRDWLKLTWLVGFLPLWLLVAAGIGLGGRGAAAPRLKREAWGLVAACVTAGVATYLAKVLVRRQRPGIHDGEYGFRPYAERFFADSGLGLPSGHVTLAFAAAWALSRICPRGRVLWFVLAIGCALNRLLEGRHFVSDVWAGAFLGAGVAALVWPRIVRDSGPRTEA